MAAKRNYFDRRMITGWAAPAMGLMIAAILATFGVGEKGIHLVIIVNERNSI